MRAVLRAAPTLLAARPLRFVLVGTLGFIVDAGVLHVLAFALGMNLLVGRAISFISAATVTWLANRTATFQDKVQLGERLPTEWSRYILASSAGGAVNYAAFTAAVELSAAAARWPTAAVALGSVAGMAVNYILYSVYVFRGGRRKAASQSVFAESGKAREQSACSRRP